jgi:hypothetical protein
MAINIFPMNQENNLKKQAIDSILDPKTENMLCICMHDPDKMNSHSDDEGATMHVIGKGEDISSAIAILMFEDIEFQSIIVEAILMLEALEQEKTSQN